MTLIGPFLMLAFWVAVFIGWVINIVELFSTAFDPLTALAVLRVVGIFVPALGAVMGYFF